MSAAELESAEIMRYDPTLGTCKYYHQEESIFKVMVWEDEPGFHGPDGYLVEGGTYDFDDEENKAYRLIDPPAEYQADEVNNDLARGRRDDSTTGKLESLKHEFRLNDPNWIDLIGAVNSKN